MVSDEWVCGHGVTETQRKAKMQGTKKNAKRSAWRITRLTKTFYAKGQLLVK